MSNVKERYIRATHSGNLTMTTLEMRDSDILASSGWAGQLSHGGLGAMLLRLSAEVDSVTRKQVELSEKDFTLKILVMMKLRTLRAALSVMTGYADSANQRLGTGLSSATIADIVGYAVQSWLWPQCATCDGRGMVGEYGTVQNICTDCGGSGKHRDISLGFNEDLLKADIIRVMDKCTLDATVNMSRLLAE
jgi:hypothetical protein